MLTKLLRLIIITGVVLMVVSCKPSGTTESGTGTTTNQSQANQAEGSSQVQSSQPDNNNPSAFQGGITVRDGYEQALQKALEWSPSAILSEVVQSPINQEGKSQSWIYYFADDALKSPEDRSMGFYVIVGEQGVTEAKPGNIYAGENQLQGLTADWQIDAGQAFSACEQVGGADLRASNPVIYTSAWLRAYDYQDPNGLPQPTVKNIYWILTYNDPTMGQAMTCEVDGNTGEVFRLSKELSNDASVQPITAKTGFPTALAKAQEWNPEATLLSVRPEFPNEDRTGPIDGVAKYWRYQFIVLPAPSEADYQPGYEVVVGSNGLMNFRAMPAYASYVTYGSQADWVTDSDEAFRVSEENGGKAYRDQHNDVQMGMELTFGFYPIDELNTSKNIRWDTRYSSESDYENELYYQIDGTTGELVYQR